METATVCKNWYPINRDNFIYLEGSETRPEGWRRVIYIAKFVGLKEPNENGGCGVMLLDEIQAIAKHVYVDLMRKLEQAVDVPGTCLKVCPDFHIETSLEEESSLHFDIFGPRNEGIRLDHDDMLKILSFKDDLLSTMEAPLTDHRCACHSSSSWVFFKCSKKSIEHKEEETTEKIDDA